MSELKLDLTRMVLLRTEREEEQGTRLLRTISMLLVGEGNL